MSFLKSNFKTYFGLFLRILWLSEGKENLNLFKLLDCKSLVEFFFYYVVSIIRKWIKYGDIKVFNSDLYSFVLVKYYDFR